MRSSARLLLLILLPILIVIVPLLVGGGIAQHVLRQQMVDYQGRQDLDLSSLSEAARVVQAFGNLHERATRVLNDATAGELSSLQLYRAHTALVDELAELQGAVDQLAASPLLTEINHGSAEVLHEAFSQYRSFIIVATEIAVIDQSTAMRNLSEANERFILFSRANQRISERLANRVGERSRDSFSRIDVFMQTAAWLALGVLLFLSALALWSARWLNRNLMVVTQALVDMASAHHQGDTNRIQQVQVISEDTRHAFQPIAGALMQLRQADAKRRVAEQNAYRLAYFDSLTGLPNWARLTGLLEEQLRLQTATGQCALLILDLDNFKDINDSYGHQKGDLLLVEVASRLKTIANSHQIARLGGDEFAILMVPETAQDRIDEPTVERLAMAIRQALSEPYLIEGDRFFLTASIGIVLADGSEHEVEALFKYADSAMNRAKRLGRNAHCFFDPKVQSELEAISQLERDMRQALETEAFSLHYQVQVDDQQGAIGVEALLRWQHAEQGMMSPATFIPLAEETGLIVPLGYWVLQEACQQLAQWQSNPETRSLTMAVNVSPQQFLNDEFCDRIAAILKKTGANPALLKLELTESTLLTGVEETIGKMHALRALGLTFSLDDFGTGYSSLQYLKRLPISQLKIDQSFVCDLHRNPEDKAIVRTIIAMSEALQVQVIAEGVESQSQFDFLLSEGCYAFQGYYFARPVPAESLAVLLKRNDNRNDG